LRTCVRLLVCLFAFTAFSRAQEQPLEPAHLVIWAWPPGCHVYIRAVSNDNNLVYLGKVNEPCLIDKRKFPTGMTFYIGGAKPDGAAEVPGVHGYQSRKFDARSVFSTAGPPPPGSSLAGDVYYLPELDRANGYRLEPAPGVLAWAQRLGLWFQLHQLVTAALLAGMGGLLFAFVGVVVPRYRAWKLEQEKVSAFNARLRSLDVKNDVFLARQFGPWVTVKRLGAGGMAVVYKGVSTETMDETQAVAIKVMNPELAQDVEYRRRFNREIQISRTLDHPNVVRMIDYGEQDGILYLSMEYIQGDTLRDLIPEKGLPLHEALPHALGICSGLIHAHQKGIVHRDLKPDNVMVTQSSLVKVMDLGLAKREESENVTKTGDTFGTPAYMSPEQITGGTLMPATDQYAFGVMLFEMLTGRRPFEVADSLTLVMKHLQEPPPRIRSYKSHLPEELEAVIDRMLLKDPAKRFKSLAEVQAELAKIQRKYAGG
jgi:predicted Ser/Thr protein kinase